MVYSVAICILFCAPVRSVGSANSSSDAFASFFDLVHEYQDKADVLPAEYHELKKLPRKCEHRKRGESLILQLLANHKSDLQRHEADVVKIQSDLRDKKKLVNDTCCKSMHDNSKETADIVSAMQELALDFTRQEVLRESAKFSQDSAAAIGTCFHRVVDIH